MGGLNFGFETKRLPLGVMQDSSPSLTGLLEKVAKHISVLQGRDVTDLASGIRSIALGLLDDASSLGKSGRSAMDEVERWYASLPTARRTPILVYIQHAQVVHSPVLSELIYVLSLRSNMPVRVLLSVSSISTFMASVSHIDPCRVEVDILGLGAKRAAGDSVAAILRANASAAESKLRIGQELMVEMEEDERMFGGGAACALKALRWRLLHHGVNSPLTTLVTRDEEAYENVEAVLRGEIDDTKLLGNLLEMYPTREASATLNPAPRVAVLHALSTTAAYTDRLVKRARAVDASIKPAERLAVVGAEQQTTTPRSAKRRKRNLIIMSPEDDPVPTTVPADVAPAQTIHSDVAGDPSDKAGEFKELEVLFNLWRGAGRNVNLWDWLEAFRGSLMSCAAGEKEEDAVEVDGEAADAPVIGTEEGGEGHATEEARATKLGAEMAQPEVEDDAADEENAARLHAMFVRFCEEARILGLVRARGRARRADEVVKSIGFI